MYVNRDFYNSLSDSTKKAFEVSTNASLSKSMSYWITEYSKTLKDLSRNHGVIFEDTPSDYFIEYMAATKKHFNLQLTKMSSLQKHRKQPWRILESKLCPDSSPVRKLFP